MSSREIAELTGKTHANVCRDIRNMLAQLGADQISFESVYFDANNQQRTEYLLPRRECEILVCGYDVVRRAAVIDRWLELETKQRQLPNMTPTQMIAELTGKSHTHVCRDIRNMLEQLNVEQKPFLDFDNSGGGGS
ncbi:Rha family transcriptional regulator [Shewanella algae]|uniref:Rha family transcriptional regulator n=1 Tax=Shewanella algae TaxID=38313 RepID=UPI001C57C9F7|nr:Rha family transcriptional regulator [Shewanella algae]